MAIAFNKITHEWASTDTPELLSADWIVDPIFTDKAFAMAIGPAFWTFSGNTINTPTQIEYDAIMLTNKKEEMWRLVREYRDTLVFSGVTVNTNTYQTDPVSRIQYIGMDNYGSTLPTGLSWKTAASSFVEMTPTLVGSIVDAIAARDKALYSAAETKRFEINASSNLDNYDPYSGWPTSFPALDIGDLSGTYLTSTVNEHGRLISGVAVDTLGTGFVKTNGSSNLSIDTNTYLIGNQAISLTGDISGSGTTSIAGTLATVNSNVGSFGSSTLIPVVTVNAKGLITAVSTTAVSGGSPAGASGTLQYNNAGAFGGLTNVKADNGDLVLSLGTPTAPAADSVKLFDKKIANRNFLAFMGPSGLGAIVQSHMGRNSIALWQPAGNSTTISETGAAALTATGTATAANVANTNLHTYMKRLEYLVTVAATTAVAGFRSTAAMYTVGSTTAGWGGFYFNCRWGPATGVSTATNRAFAGMGSATAAPTDVEPSTITNIIGMGWDAADTNIQLMHRGAGAVTKIDLGASFPVPTVDRSKVYELVLFSPPGTTQSVGYQITDLGTGATATGVITTNLPSTATFLAPRGWASAGGTLSVVGIALMNLYIETDY